MSVVARISAWRTRVVSRISEPRTQASLFHYIKTEPEPSLWSSIDWSALRHPIRFLREEWREPRTRASLFHYIDDTREQGVPLTAGELIHDLVASFRAPLFIPSVFADVESLTLERERMRSRRLRAGSLSVLIHAGLLAFALYLMYRRVDTLPIKDNIVFVSPPFYSPYESTGPDGGGGGGGGKGEKTPPSSGRMPDTTRIQFTAPDPENPMPLTPAEDLLAAAASVVMPIDIPQDQSLPVGDVAAPPNDRRSSGPGSGGGIGTGVGTGVGSGIGPGVGPGSGGGMGGGSGGGIGSGQGPYVVGGGVRPPTPILQPLPQYTEEARKARIEGIVLIRAVVRKDGTIDSFKILKGLGYGLDESAINTIATKWRFKPGTLNGAAVDVQANIEVAFRLY